MTIVGSLIVIVIVIKLGSIDVPMVPVWASSLLVAAGVVAHIVSESWGGYASWRNETWHKCVPGYPVTDKKAARVDRWLNGVAQVGLAVAGIFYPAAHLFLAGLMLIDGCIHLLMRWRSGDRRPPGYRTACAGLLPASAFLIASNWQALITHPGGLVFATGCLPFLFNFLFESEQARGFQQNVR